MVIVELSPDYTAEPSTRRSPRKMPTSQPDKFSSQRPQKEAVITKPDRFPTAPVNGNANIGEKIDRSNRVHGVSASSSESTSPLTENIHDVDSHTAMNTQHANGTSSHKGLSYMNTCSVSALEVRNPDLSAAAKAIQVSVPPHLRVISGYFGVSRRACSFLILPTNFKLEAKDKPTYYL